MKINFTKKQFEILLKLGYLGNWMVNAHRDGSPDDSHKKEYEEIENYIFSFAKEFGFGEWVNDEDASEGKFYPTRKFEEETDVHELHNEYDEETFWDEIIDRLGERDFYRQYSKDEIKNMSKDEWLEKLHECIDRWIDEINANGIERLKIEEN